MHGTENKRRILTFQPLVYRQGDERFRVTNLGALASALNDLGHEATQVALSPDSSQAGKIVEGIIHATLPDASNPDWWKAMNPWGVITNTWGAPRFENIRNAILQATPRVADRLDTDGNCSVRIEAPFYIYAMWSGLRDMRDKPLKQWLSPILPFGHALIHSWIPSLLDKRMTAVMDRIPVVTAESPIALARMIRFQQMFGYTGKNFHLSPFPINERAADPVKSAGARKNRIISVARWDAHQKNFPLMLRTLEGFLRAHPDWDALLPGSLPRDSEGMLRKLCPQAGQRINLAGHLAHGQIAEEMAGAKIYLTTSRHEGFSIAVAEALCSGCSIVGPHQIAGMPWCCGSDSGTVAALYTRNGMLDALSAEAREWQSGHRCPEHIAHVWKARVGAKSVATRMLNLLERCAP